MKIGFIGLGIMGGRMAANLQQSGHDLIIHNRTRAKADALVAQGATWAGSPAKVAAQVGLLVTMLANPEAVLEVALGDHGFLDQLKTGALWMDCSTVNPSFSRQMADEAAARGIRFVDAPVSGTAGPAEQAQLIFLVGGEQGDVEACQPLFEAMGRETIHVGGHGMGSALKMVNNLLLGTAMATFAEGVALGHSLGIPFQLLMDVLPGSPVVAPFVTGKQPKIEAGQYEPDFPLKWMRKDLQLAAITAYEANVPLPTVNAAKELFALAAADGFGEQDFSSICQYLVDKTGPSADSG